MYNGWLFLTVKRQTYAVLTSVDGLRPLHIEALIAGMAIRRQEREMRRYDLVPEYAGSNAAAQAGNMTDLMMEKRHIAVFALILPQWKRAAAKMLFIVAVCFCVT